MLSFASPSHMDVVNAENEGAFFRKRKYPKRRRPYAACFLCAVVFVAPPNGLYPTKPTVLGAAKGLKTGACVT
jgi:hypothetical protein